MPTVQLPAMPARSPTTLPSAVAFRVDIRLVDLEVLHRRDEHEIARRLVEGARRRGAGVAAVALLDVAGVVVTLLELAGELDLQARVHVPAVAGPEAEGTLRPRLPLTFLGRRAVVVGLERAVDPEGRAFPCPSCGPRSRRTLRRKGSSRSRVAGLDRPGPPHEPPSAGRSGAGERPDAVLCRRTGPGAPRRLRDRGSRQPDAASTWPRGCRSSSPSDR